ncbi:MAG: DMT family protein [Verrucomicrobiia bacterium]
MNWSAYLIPVGLLTVSNIFMTVAWYGHLKFKHWPLLTVILLSWGIAFFEYCLQVPANRMGHAVMSAYQLKVIQEALTLLIFVGFALVWLGEPLRPKYVVSFGLIFAAVAVAFGRWGE